MRPTEEEGAMRAMTIALVLVVFGAAEPVRAQGANNCKLCADAQRACAKNHSRAACGTEYDICMKHCRKK
jgi:hypothetical protein